MADVWFEALDVILPNIHDLNDDELVNWDDIVIIYENWLVNGPNIPGDFDENNIVNFLDFTELAGCL